MGHGRGAAVGDALGRILEFTGHKVVREYYVNDVGNQMDNLGRSLLARYRTECGRPTDLPEDGYRGEYMIELAREFRADHGDRYADAPTEEALPLFRKEAGDRILARDPGGPRDVPGAVRRLVPRKGAARPGR